MNNNYEWNKQFTQQRSQARYREAALHRQVNQYTATNKRHKQLFELPSSVIALVRKLRELDWTIVTRPMRQN